MEQIKVNMTPCGFTPTIHASQDDNSTRKWGFELYDEDGKIDSSSIKEQMIFDAKEGGTEQILPENTSDPTTSPIIADIQYPDSLRSEQTFLYRESPTSEDGQAKITHIKGNTLVWNQLVYENVERTLDRDNARTMFVSTNNVYCVSGHKYYFSLNITSNNNNQTIGVQYNIDTLMGNGTGRRGRIATATNSDFASIYVYMPSSAPSGSIIKFKDFICMDLTAMGKDSMTLSEFEDWLSTYYYLPYYSYTTGKLLPFVGTELKTVGFNQWDEEWELGYYSTTTGEKASSNTNIRSKNYIKVLPNTTYYYKSSSASGNDQMLFYDGNKTYISSINIARNTTFSTPSNAQYMTFFCGGSYGTTYNNDICINISSSENGKYEPYTSSTINLPTLTYFSSGMKSAGSVYDEITENKATQRIGEIVVDGNDIGISSASSSSSGNYFVVDYRKYTNVKIDTSNITVQCSHTFKPVSFDQRTADNSFDKCYSDSQARIILRNSSANTTLGLTAESANTWLASNPLTIYFELATPTEESITTASLVTEKGETPLYYDDELIADCNETISSESGIFDAKIKLMDDETVYSQNIQLHVERKP